MSDSALPQEESEGDRADRPPRRSRSGSSGQRGTPPIIEKVVTMSDRAIQRVTGGNAFLRGRLYARRKSVENLDVEGRRVAGEILIRNQDEPYRTEVTFTQEEEFVSKCSCPGWRGPEAHCKHVAAVIVALRDRERPARPKVDESPAQGTSNGTGKKKRKKKKKNADKSPPVHVPQTVSVGGKRRRSRRRRRGNGAAEKLEVVSQISGPKGHSRGAIDAWLPPDALDRHHDIEYRLVVRPTSMQVTAVIAGTRNALPIADALTTFNAVSVEDRPLMRMLGRHANRGQATTSDIRGEDAADVVSALEGRRVLIEPASMELRFSDEALKPVIELDRVDDKTLRTRVVFVGESSQRRFLLSSGAWFEGTPGWHIDASDGVARPLDESVTPGWLTRLLRSPNLVHPAEEMPRLLGDHIPQVAVKLRADLPDLSSIADLVDAKPEIQLWCEGDIVHTLASLKVTYGDQAFDIPPDSFPHPLAFLPPSDGDDRPRVVRRDVGAEMTAVQQMMDQGFEVEDGVLLARGEDAIDFWSGGIGELPEEWERFVPDALANVKVRNESVSAQMRVSSGVDWLSLDMAFSAGGSSVSENELRAALETGRRVVKLEDGTYAPIDADEVGEVLARMAEIYASTGQKKKLPLSQAGRIQDLLSMVGDHKVTPKAKELFGQLEDIDEVPVVAKPRGLVAELRPYQKKGFSWLAFLHQLGAGGILADDMGLGKTLQTIALLQWAKQKYKRKLSMVVAPTSVVPNWEREIHKFAPKLKVVVWHGPDRHDRQSELEKADVMITSYALLRRDEELFGSLDLRYLILDEAQHIKNPMSHTARAAKAVSSERRLALTGTPIENRLSELWSIFRFRVSRASGRLEVF